jgi:acetyl esterase/lipase
MHPRILTAIAIFGGLILSVATQADPLAHPATVPTTREAPFTNLWPDHKVPHAQGEEAIDTPALQIFLSPSSKATGSAVVVFPGGGYGHLAAHEGGKVAQWLAENGISGFVLRYRLGPKYHYPAEIEDGQRAVRFVRAHAAEYGIDPKRIGIIGFSAGGHLASSVATHYTSGDPAAEDVVDRVSSRPDLHILIYPVINMDGPDAHVGSRNNLFGKEELKPELFELFSNHKQVTKETPPAFLVHSVTDKTVAISNSDNYVKALELAGVPHEYVRLETGIHGFGLTDQWTQQCIEWLRKYKF